MVVCKHDWPEVLAAYLFARQHQAFAWGSMDCCLFACDAVLEMTGTDLAVDFRGKYDSALSAARVLKDYGGVAGVAAAIAELHQIQEIPVLMAQRGDVVLLTGPMGEALAIVGLNGTHAVSAGPDGAAAVPLSECLKAWRIPKA